MIHSAYPLLPSAEKRARLWDYVSSQPDWFHTFDFGDGLVSSGRDPSAKKLHHLCLPRTLSGLTVLDLGAYDGYFSFQCESRGATCTACDRVVWEWEGSTARSNFEAVHDALDSRVESVTSLIEDLPDSFVGKTFDITLFLGVLYHAPDPVQYLRSVYSVTKTVCIVETLVDALDQPTAQARFYKAGEMNGDNTNWWGPNLAATNALLLRAGFSRVEFMNMWDVNTRDALAGRDTQTAVTSGRAVFYAFV